jgi:hypothetical protein
MLLTTAEASLMLALSERTACKLLTEMGVQPIDLGGRRGLRWYKDEITDALETRRRGKPAKPRKASASPKEWDKPVAQIMASLLGGTT